MNSSRPCLGPFLLALPFLFAAPLLAQAQEAQPRTSSNPPAQLAGVRAEEVPQEEAYAAMKKLNAKGELLAISQYTPWRYKGLKQENCHGWRFPGGARLLWESAGRHYGHPTGEVPCRSCEMKIYQNIGIVYAEMDFHIASEPFHKGPYMVYASPEALRVMGYTASKTFPLEQKLDLAEFDAAAKKAPRFTFVQDKDGLFLKIGENQFAFSPQ